MLNKDPLGDVARHLFDAAVAAADPALAVRRAFDRVNIPAAPGGIHLIAVGKAAPAMLREAMAQVPDARTAMAVTHHANSATVPGATLFHAGHPVPDADGAAAAREVLARLDAAGAEAHVIALISGGGSALLPAPVPGITLDDKIRTSEILLGAGLDITRMNLVRQQLSLLKGGGFVQRAAPASVTAFILSDVIGDDLRVIASGPTVRPIGTRAEAAALCRTSGVWQALPAAVREHLQRAAPAKDVPKARNVLVGSNRHSLDAMAAAARTRGWDAIVVNDRLVGDVAQAAREILSHLKPADHPMALLFGGETTVAVRGTGRGGRNQELALRVALGAPEIAGDWLFLSAGTDGRDGPTDAAGGMVDRTTAQRVPDAAALLANNDSHAALDAAGALLVTGATGTNVADVQALLIRP